MGQVLKRVTAILGTKSTSQENDPLLTRATSPPSPCSDPSASRTFTLANGDTIAYSTCGPASAPAVFLLHGYPGSRIHGLFFRPLAEKVGLRIICPDRPGLGLSTPSSPDRKVLDYPDSIGQLAQHLGLESYRILGWSGGGSFALACAKALPKEQLIRVGLLAGMGPADIGLGGMRIQSRILLRSTTWFPGLMRLLLKWTIVRKAQDPDPEVLQRHIAAQMKWVRGQDKKDLEEILAAIPSAMDIMVEGTREHFRQGADGFVREGQLVMEPWGFDLKDIETEVMLWYGTADTNVPIRIGREMAKMLKKAELKEYEEENHLTLVTHHAEEVFRELLKD